MSQWGAYDNAANSPFWASALVGRRETTANQSALFANTLADEISPNMVVGTFGVSTDELLGKGGIDTVSVAWPGDSFTDRPTVAFSGANDDIATATATATVVSLESVVDFAQSGWDVGDSIVINESGATNTSSPDIVVASVEVLTVALGSNTGSGYANGDTITIVEGGTANATVNVSEVDGSGSLVSVELLTAGAYTTAPSEEDATIETDGSGIDATLNVTLGVASVTINDGGQFTALPSTTSNNVVTTDGDGVGGFDIDFGVGEVTVTANGAGYVYGQVGVSFGEGANASGTITLLGDSGRGIEPSHAGWVLRKVGTGGRAGRVQTEVLVAGKSFGQTDASDDDVYPE